MVARAHFERRDEGRRERRVVAFQVPVEAPGVVLDGDFLERAVGPPLAPRVDPRERGLDAVARVVGERQADRAGGRDGQQMRVAQAVRADALLQRRGQARRERAALQQQVGVEEREGPALRGQPRGRLVGGVAHRLRNARRHRARLVAVVAQVQHHERVAQAGEPEADTPLVHRLLLLPRQRPRGDVEHVVEHAHGDARELGEAGVVERGIGLEGPAHELREVDGAEAAAAVGGKRLLSTVVHHQSVRIEGMHALDGHVVDRFDAVILERVHRRAEALAVQAALAGAQQFVEPRGLRGVFEADPLGEDGQVRTAHDQLMLGLALVVPVAAPTVGHRPGARRTPLPIQSGRYSEPQQHPLRRFEQRQARLRETHADALRLTPLHRTVGVEQAAQQSSAEIRRVGFHRGRDRLAPGCRAELEREMPKRARREAAFAVVQ